MSLSVSLFIILLTMGNILGCWWLIRWTQKPRANESTLGDTTGHTWDGDLTEYNNPLPRWWLWLFYITIVFGLAYLVAYPGLGHFQGLLGWSQEDQYVAEMNRAEETFGPVFQQYASQDIPTLAANEEAQKIGQRLFVTYCASCHGSDARGAPGFPNLADNDWLYGGDPAAIETSILKGRQGAMPGWAASLGEGGVSNVTQYVISLSGREADATQLEAGQNAFMTYCAACHGAEGKGNPMLGAPNLTDNVWLYGGSAGAIAKTVSEGRQGRMPAHQEFLGEDKVHLLAAYVYGLSQGK